MQYDGKHFILKNKKVLNYMVVNEKTGDRIKH